MEDTQHQGYFIVSPDPSWGRGKHWFKLLRLARVLSKLPSDAWFIGMILEDDDEDDGADRLLEKQFPDGDSESFR